MALLEPVEIDRVVDVVHRVELVRPDREPAMDARRRGVGGSGTRPTGPIELRAAEHLGEDRRDPGQGAAGVDQHPVGVDPAGRASRRRRRNSPRRRAKTRRMPDDRRPGAERRAHAGRARGSPARRPGRATSGRARRTSRGRTRARVEWMPGDVLGVADEARRPEQAVRARLVEPDPVGRPVQVAAAGVRSATRRSRRRAPPASSSSVSSATSRGRQRAGAVSRSSRTSHDRRGVEDDERRGERARPRRAACVRASSS